MFIHKESWVEAADTILALINKKDREKVTLSKEEKDLLYKDAINYYDKAKKYLKALEICEIIEDYPLIIALIIKYETYLKYFCSMFEKKVKKYCCEVEIKILSKCKYLFCFILTNKKK